MSKVTVNGQEFDADAVANLMDDDLRDELYNRTGGEITIQEFVDLYCVAHREQFGVDFIVN